MIPIRLALSNFMCYRDNVPPLYLNGVHTASICGSNGHGKSALIDAMTWALWGQTRAKRDDDLIHTGEAETSVEFDFAVGEQGYRILRRHRKPKRRGVSGQSILEFQMAVDGDFRPITGNTIQQTQQKIIDTLHMDYATFTNSAYLRQGHADEFTTSNPARRKQVLGNILGLSYYDTLEAQAKELAKQQETKKEQLESAIADINEELARKPSYEAELEQAQEGLSRISARVKEHEAHLNQLRQQKEAFEAKNWQLTQLEEHITQQTRTLGQWDEQIKQQQSRLKEHEDLIARRASIEAGYAQLVEVKKSNDELEQKFRQSVNLERQKAQLELKIKEAGQDVLAEHAVAQRTISELEARVDRLPQLRAELQQAQHHLQHLTEEEEVLGQKGTAGQELRTRLHGLEMSQSQLERDITEIAEKLDLLLTEHGAKCPLCETELGTESLKLIETKYTSEKQQKSESLETTRTGLASGKTELKSLENEIVQLEARLKKERATLQGRVSVLVQETDEAEQAGKQLEEERSRLSEIEERLARRDFAAPQQELLANIEKELVSLDYDTQQHEQVRQQLSGLEQYEEPKRKLEEAERLIEDERAALARATEASQQLRTSLETDIQKKEGLVRELALLPKVSDDLSRTESEHQNLTAEQERAQELTGSIKGKLERCAELETRKKEREKLITETTQEEQIYRDLAEAFGKKGIQALLIETALPEIESEANRLLGRMTDNRMNVKIETQRETRKGDTIETLDINIADELGTRNYEMFSGGEAFRINFAIRIALSKLLARRAGAPLPTLIIDEGFGTQDTIGIEKLREAINSIQDDFEKILVITHIEELRDAFPTRIDVVKTTDGSTLSFG
ncbi:MAG: SMC family ATPase [Dehalococcoidales bacterium]|nr:MAG: SMC family ATPase [Dehalococcoidales bacterium]